MTKVVRAGKAPPTITDQPVIAGSIEATYSDGPRPVAVSLRCIGDFHVRAELDIAEAERLRDHLNISIARYRAEHESDFFYAVPLDTSVLGLPKHLMSREERECSSRVALCGLVKPPSRWYIVPVNGLTNQGGVCPSCYKKSKQTGS